MRKNSITNDLQEFSRFKLFKKSRTQGLDEFHNFTTQSLILMLSELRKYRLSLVLAHQYLTQLDFSIRDAVLGNVGTLIIFRIGAADAETLAPEFTPEFSAADFTALPNYHIYLKLMIDGHISRPFSAATLPPDSLLPDSPLPDSVPAASGSSATPTAEPAPPPSDLSPPVLPPPETEAPMADSA